MNAVRQRALEAQEKAATEREQQERARAAEMRAKHKAWLPEFEGFFKTLYELGLVPGWRAIVKVEQEKQGGT